MEPVCVMEPTRIPGQLTPSPLANLAHHLQEILRLENATQFETLQRQTIPLQIHCVLKDLTLMVLGQHPPHLQLLPGSVFTSLERALRTLPPELMATVFDPSLLPCQIQVKLYLRSLGQRQPHALHTFTFVPVFIASPSFLLALETATEKDIDMPAEIDIPAETDESEHTFPLETNLHLASGGDLSENSELTQENIGPLGTQPDPEFEPNLEFEPDLDFEPDVEFEPKLEPGATPTAPLARTGSSPTPQSEGFSYSVVDTRPQIPWLVMGLVGGLAAVLSSTFVLTRPCVLATCQPLQTASRLNQEFLHTVQSAQSSADLQRAQSRLEEINRQLDQVPGWSGRSADAQTLRQQSQTHSTHLQAVLAALDSASQAARQADSPSKAENGRTELELWQAAIAQLSTVPPTSPLYNVAQTKLLEFQDRLASVSRQTMSLGQAAQKLAIAKSAAKKAEDRQKTARTLEEWQLAKSTWLTAMKVLQEIPAAVPTYAEAQQLLLTYQAQLTRVNNRLDQLQQQRQAYTQTLAIADRARTLEQQNQWTAAVATWRDALQRAQQIPADAPDAAQVKILIPTYTNALKQAQGKLQTTLAQQRVQADLEKVCAGDPNICSFAIAPDVIRLQLTSAYEQSLGNAFTVGQSTEPSTYGKTVLHINTLQTALQTICNNAGIPLDVYSANGTEVVGSFNPQR